MSSPVEDSPQDGWLRPLLSGPVCFDTTVPLHMVKSGMEGALRDCFSGRVSWPPAIRAELLRSATRVPALRDLAVGSFATVVDLEPGEEQEVEDLRLESLTRSEIRMKPTKNRGEAECVIIARRLSLPVIMHDETGRAWARRYGLQLFTLIDCLCVATRLGFLKPSKAWQAYQRACADGMIPLAAFVPGPSGRIAFMTRAAPLYSLYAAGDGPQVA